MPFVPVCYCKIDKQFGIINRRKGDLVKTVTIEALSPPKAVVVCPSSNIYEIKIKSQKDQLIHTYRQVFSLCFFIATKSNNEVRSNRHKNRGLIQVFEIAVDWTEGDVNFQKAEINIVNSKLILNVNASSNDTIHQNMDKNGYIDGIQIFDEISSKQIVIERTLPHEFPFQNEITYCRYNKYYKHRKPYYRDKVQVLMVESQLTDDATNKLFPYQQLMVLNNAIRVLLNHVPYDRKEYEKYEFMESEEDVTRLFMETNNWLQPLGALGCRSMASFLFFHD